jgi:hypothetical protein
MKIGNPVRAYVVEPLEEPTAEPPEEETTEEEPQPVPLRTEREKAPAA